VVTTFNLFTSISWIVAGGISAILSSFFLRKKPRKRLNILFGLGFILWSLSLVFNGINFAVAYHSLTAANIARDLCVITGIFCALLLFLAAIGIYYGAAKVNWWSTLLVVLLATALSVVGALFDWVKEDGFGGYKTTDTFIGKTAVQIIPALFVIVGAIYLILTYRSLKHKVAKKRIGYYTLGYSTILLGLLFFLVDTFVPFSPYILQSLAIASWLSGPILMLIGFYVKLESTPGLPDDGSGAETKQALNPKHTQTLERPS
jgi:hypothetical protein